MNGMRSVQAAWVVLLAMGLMVLSCDKLGIGPEDNGEDREEHIPWPSLADSPWPMWGHDPQWTFRSPYVGPSSGDTIHAYKNAATIGDGILVGPEDHVYFPASYDSTFVDSLSHPTGSLIQLNAQFQEQWHQPVAYTALAYQGYSIATTPILLSSGEVLVLGNDRSLTWLSAQGRQVARLEEIYSDEGWGMQVGKTGNFYLVEHLVGGSRAVNAFSPEGEVLWSNADQQYSWVGPISPDGETLFVRSKRAFVAVSARGDTLWTYATGLGYGHMTVNNAGRMFAHSSVDSALVVFRATGEVLWKTSVRVQSKALRMSSYNLAIGPTGDIYIGMTDQYQNYLVCVSPTGDVQWVTVLNGRPHHIIIDADGKVYTNLVQKIVCYTEDGIKLWETPITNFDFNVVTALVINSQGDLLVPVQFEPGTEKPRGSGIITIPR